MKNRRRIAALGLSLAVVGGVLFTGTAANAATRTSQLVSKCQTYAVGTVCLHAEQVDASATGPSTDNVWITYTPAPGRGFTPTKLTAEDSHGNVVHSLTLSGVKQTANFTSKTLSFSAAYVSFHAYFNVAAGATSIDSALQPVKPL
ncbi:MAG: hypothetical protein FWD85_00600 [Microbacteriaceae bacterium]|nr:hypothetical protein [Microbacteriaceae bacterium]MCL2793784.1 hypothetical protein [Microbacteriaceae bacterium]